MCVLGVLWFALTIGPNCWAITTAYTNDCELKALKQGTSLMPIKFVHICCMPLFLHRYSAIFIFSFAVSIKSHIWPLSWSLGPMACVSLHAFCLHFQIFFSFLVLQHCMWHRELNAFIVSPQWVHASDTDMELHQITLFRYQVSKS